MIGRRKMFAIDLVVIAVLVPPVRPRAGTLSRYWSCASWWARPWGADYPIATSMTAEFFRASTGPAQGSHRGPRGYLGANVAALVVSPLQRSQRLALLASPRSLRPSSWWDLWDIPSPRAGSSREGPRRGGPGDRPLRPWAPTQPARGRGRQDLGHEGPCAAPAAHHLHRRHSQSRRSPCSPLPPFGQQIIGGAIGVDNERYALLVELLIGTFFMLSTFPAMYLCERIGRRPLIIACFGGMTVALAVVGFFPIASGWPRPPHRLRALAGGPGNLGVASTPTSLPTEVRATAMGFAMSLAPHRHGRLALHPALVQAHCR